MEDHGILNQRRPSGSRRGSVIGAWAGTVLTLGLWALGIVGGSPYPILLACVPAFYLCKAVGYDIAIYHAGILQGIILSLIFPALTNCFILSLLGGLIGLLITRLKSALKQ